MRFANALLKISVMFALASAMTGCAVIDLLEQQSTKQDKAPTDKIAPAKAASVIATAPSSVSSPAAAVATPPADGAAANAKQAAVPLVPIVPPEPPVNPAAQRLFDDANRALKAGRTDDAERGYRAIIQAHPELGGPHANLGVIYRNANKLAEAVAEFNHAARLSPKQPVYLNQLGITYRQMGQFEKARDAYEQAIAIDANYAPAILNLGILHDMYMGDGARALELFVRYLTLTPNGDTTVTKWIAELKNRKPVSATTTQKEKS